MGVTKRDQVQFQSHRNYLAFLNFWHAVKNQAFAENLFYQRVSNSKSPYAIYPKTHLVQKS